MKLKDVQWRLLIMDGRSILVSDLVLFSMEQRESLLNLKVKMIRKGVYRLA